MSGQRSVRAKDARQALTACRRVVIKVGSASLARDPAVVVRLARAVAALTARGRHVVLVSSGAIALGIKKLGYRSRPTEMAKLQAAAAAGQSLLMRSYEEAFAAEQLTVAQVLLTHADLADRTRANNARAALGALLDAGAVPILNENDSVAVDEIGFSDNDELSSLVAPLVEADLLILLSDVAGLLDGDGERVRVVYDVPTEALPLVQSARTSGTGRGGMASKLEAARRATLTGAHVVIGSALEDDVVERIVSGKDVGTLFAAAPQRISAKKYWIAFTLRPRGALVLDEGASAAVGAGKKSILAVGVRGARGDFRAGDSVLVLDHAGAEIGRGLAKAPLLDVARAAGKPQPRGEEPFVVVHRDELVVWPSPPPP